MFATILNSVLTAIPAVVAAVVSIMHASKSQQCAVDAKAHADRAAR